MMTVELTEKEHKELLSLLIFHSTGQERWVVSKELRLAVVNAKPRKEES